MTFLSGCPKKEKRPNNLHFVNCDVLGVRFLHQGRPDFTRRSCLRVNQFSIAHGQQVVNVHIHPVSKPPEAEVIQTLDVEQFIVGRNYLQKTKSSVFRSQMISLSCVKPKRHVPLRDSCMWKTNKSSKNKNKPLSIFLLSMLSLHKHTGTNSHPGHPAQYPSGWCRPRTTEDCCWIAEMFALEKVSTARSTTGHGEEFIRLKKILFVWIFACTVDMRPTVGRLQ